MTRASLARQSQICARLGLTGTRPELLIWLRLVSCAARKRTRVVCVCACLAWCAGVPVHWCQECAGVRTPDPRIGYEGARTLRGHALFLQLLNGTKLNRVGQR